MKNNWLFSMDFDEKTSFELPMDAFLSQGVGRHLYSQFIHSSRHFYIPGSLALQEAFNNVSRFAGSLFLWIANGSNQNIQRSLSSKPNGSNTSCPQVEHIATCKRNLVGFCSSFKSRAESSVPSLFSKIASTTMINIWKELEQLQSFPVLSLAAALVPPLDDLSRRVLAMPLENSDVQIKGKKDQTFCICRRPGSADLSLHDMKWSTDAVEPVTGIKFPTVLDDMLDGGNKSTIGAEVLVGTGSRSMKIFKVKSLKVYAFGLYVQPHSICKSLGSKYASVPVGELNNQPDFFDDLLREDIHMTVRLVVNCNGLKISAVRDVFEKSLRARLVKANPSTDYHCLRTFDTYFSQDIPLPSGTTISFQQTPDGQLITEIGGKQIGVVHSKDLCRAFFGMYIGDAPISLQAKEEIARNVGSIIRRC